MEAEAEPYGANEEELELVASMAAGATEALAALYDRYASLLMSLGMRILKDREEVEDLLHDVFVEVWEKAGSYDPARGSVRTWLCLRMRSRALDRCKLSRRRLTGALDESESGNGAIGPELVHEPSIEVLGRDRLRAALKQLPDTQHTVIVLAYFEGLSCSEIASTLDLPIGTVKSRLAGARKGLQQSMAREGVVS